MAPGGDPLHARVRGAAVLLLLTAACAVTSGDLGSVPTGTVTVDGVELTVAVAATPEARSQGLRGVDDLGDLDGMLFVWGGDTVTSRFTMADTLMALDVVFFDAGGALVDAFRMEPCRSRPCPSYQASGPYAYALETPAGTGPQGGRLTVVSLP